MVRVMLLLQTYMALMAQVLSVLAHLWDTRPHPKCKKTSMNNCHWGISANSSTWPKFQFFVWSKNWSMVHFSTHTCLPYILCNRVACSSQFLKLRIHFVQKVGISFRFVVRVSEQSSQQLVKHCSWWIMLSVLALALHNEGLSSELAGHSSS